MCLWYDDDYCIYEWLTLSHRGCVCLSFCLPLSYCVTSLCVCVCVVVLWFCCVSSRAQNQLHDWTVVCAWRQRSWIHTHPRSNGLRHVLCIQSIVSQHCSFMKWNMTGSSTVLCYTADSSGLEPQRQACVLLFYTDWPSHRHLYTSTVSEWPSMDQCSTCWAASRLEIEPRVPVARWVRGSQERQECVGLWGKGGILRDVVPVY